MNLMQIKTSWFRLPNVIDFLKSIVLFPGLCVNVPKNTYSVYYLFLSTTNLTAVRGPFCGPHFRLILHHFLHIPKKHHSHVKHCRLAQYTHIISPSAPPASLAYKSMYLVDVHGIRGSLQGTFRTEIMPPAIPSTDTAPHNRSS